MGGAQVKQPDTPKPETTAEAMQSYVASLPYLYEAQMKYEPAIQAQNLALQQTYGLEFGKAQKAINDALYPDTAKIQEQLANQSLAGMNGTIPQWAQDSYQNQLNANIGTNAGSPIAGDYVSRGMMEQQKGWQDYYRNLGLSVAGRQPLASGGTSSQLNYMQGYQPNQGLNYSSTSYGNYSNAYASMYATNQRQAQANQENTQGYAKMGASMVGSMI